MTNKILLAVLLLIISNLVFIEAADIFKDKKCKSNEDCNKYPYEVCNTNTQKCIHKDVFPVYGQEFVGIMLFPILIAFAIVGGVGGGGIVAPLTIALFKFSTNNSIAISTFTVLLSSITRFFVNINSKHPEKDAVVIDYGISAVVVPIVMIGNFIGVFLNIILPEMILQIILAALLLLLAL